MTKIGPSFPINTAAFAAGIEVVRDTAHVDRVLAHNRKWVDELSRLFRSMGLKVYPSQTNFILVEFSSEPGKTADEANSWLNQNGIIPRQFAVESFDNKLRFTVGNDEGMRRTIDAMDLFLSV